MPEAGETITPPGIDQVGLRETVVNSETGRKYTLEKITSPEDPRLVEIQKLLESNFPKEELDSFDVLKASIEGRDAKTGETFPKYIVCVAQGENGEVIGVATGAAVEMQNEDYEPVGKDAVVVGAYLAVTDEHQRQGIASNLFDFRVRAVGKDATERGLKIAGYVGEIKDENAIRGLMETKGVRSVYVQNKDAYEEVPYFQPPIDWDPKTGKAAEGAKTVPEQLMIGLTKDATTISANRLLQMVRAIYSYNNWQFEGFFDNKKAYKQHSGTMEGIEEKLTSAVEGKKIHLFSQAQKAQMSSEGAVFKPHEGFQAATSGSAK